VDIVENNPTGQGNRALNSLDIRVTERFRVSPRSASYGVNLLAHCSQKSGFRHHPSGLCRQNQLHDLRSVPDKSKCDCPAICVPISH